MRLAANLTWLFTERPFPERCLDAARAGFDAVEVLFPYDIPATTLHDMVTEAGLPLALINTPKGITTGRAAIPGEEAEFRRDFALAANYARSSGATVVHIMSGVTCAPNARATLVANLGQAARKAPDLVLTIEPLNPKDAPGYFLNDFFLAADIVAEIGAPNVRLQFDSYHAAMIHGDACETWRSVGQLDGHVQIAAAPDRTEPDRETLDFLRLLRTSGYDGIVSAEYGPKGRTEDGLGWLAEAREIIS